jgi:Family of unknown function (DUF6152)
MRDVFALLSLAVALLCPSGPLHAHHSFATEFDAAKPVTLHGKLTKIDWTNPHVFLWMDVESTNGTIANWTLESVAPNYFVRLGWTRQTLKVGDTVTIRAFLAKDRPNMAKTDAIDLPDGRRVTTGRADDSAHKP